MSVPTIRLIAWAEAGQDALIRDVAGRASIELAAVGAPEAGAAAELSETLHARRAPHLRDAILRGDADVLWLATGRALEADERRLLRETPVVAVSSEPVPGSVADVIADAAEAETARFVPLMRHSPGFRAAEQVFDQLGDRQSVSVFLGGGPGQGTLFARLYDAMDLVEALGGPAERLDAALWRPGAGVPDHLRGLRGHMTVNVRYAGARCACVAASDAAGRWTRRVIVLAEGGRMEITDDAFEWIAPDGRVVEHRGDGETLTPGALVAMQVRRLLDGGDDLDPRPDTARILALCEAARLSARTGAGEAPGTMLEMLRRP